MVPKILSRAWSKDSCLLGGKLVFFLFPDLWFAPSLWLLGRFMLFDSCPANALTWLPMSSMLLIWSLDDCSMLRCCCFLFVYMSSASGSSPITSFYRSVWRFVNAWLGLAFRTFFLPLPRITLLRWKSSNIEFAVINSYRALALINIRRSSFLTSSSKSISLACFSLSRLNILVGLNSSVRLLALADVVLTLKCFVSAVETAFCLMFGRLGFDMTDTFADCFRADPELPKLRFFWRLRWV